jgi:hypothetical protein
MYIKYLPRCLAHLFPSLCPPLLFVNGFLNEFMWTSYWFGSDTITVSNNKVPQFSSIHMTFMHVWRWPYSLGRLNTETLAVSGLFFQCFHLAEIHAYTFYMLWFSEGPTCIVFSLNSLACRWRHQYSEKSLILWEEHSHQTSSSPGRQWEWLSKWGN